MKLIWFFFFLVCNILIVSANDEKKIYVKKISKIRVFLKSTFDSDFVESYSDFIFYVNEFKRQRNDITFIDVKKSIVINGEKLHLRKNDTCLIFVKNNTAFQKECEILSTIDYLTVANSFFGVVSDNNTAH